jgi:hypothetical protein
MWKSYVALEKFHQIFFLQDICGIREEQRNFSGAPGE